MATRSIQIGVCKLNRKIFALIALVAFQTLVPDANASSATYVFPVQGCATTYAHSHHDYPATDILLVKPHPSSCYFVAPTSGVIDEVNRVDRFSWKTDKGAERGGLSISMVGDDGVRYYGSHLKLIEKQMAPGFRVAAGDRLGILGNGGDAKGLATHLHFGISWPTTPGAWWIRRGELYPWTYLDAWRKGINASPASGVKKLHATLGDLPPCKKGC
jgi:hypothetical protein